MGINSKIAKIPFFVLYLTLVSFTSYNWIRVILFQKDFEVFLAEQPWDYYLSKFASNTFGITNQQYFLFAFPVMLVFLYLVPKLFGKLMNLDKKTNIKGDNYIAVIGILLVTPSILGVHKLLGPGWRNRLLPGFILIILFFILSGIDEKKFKQLSK